METINAEVMVLGFSKIEDVIRMNINLSQLQRNVKAISELINPAVKFMAVVKGDAYGHGLVPVAEALAEFGCDSLGVVRISEAISLRKAGISVPIMMLAPVMPNQIEAVIANDLTIMIDDGTIAYEADKICKDHNKTVRIHVKINTGLNRFGIVPDKAVEFIRDVKNNCSRLEIEGVYTHFRDPEFNKSFTDTQIALFDDVLEKLNKEGLRPPIAHAAATGGILMYPQTHYDMIRCGILLYGEEYLKGRKVIPKKIKPLTSLISKIIKINEIHQGQPIGYGDRHIADRNSRIAVIAGGYGDGVSRGWKQVLINGQRVPVINYAMDCLEVDITDIDGDIHEYDDAVLIGHQGNEMITWEEACYGLNSEVDEQLQRITARVPKNYYYEK